MTRWDEATRRLSRKVLKQVMRLGTPETNWWTYSDVVEEALRMYPGELYNAVRLLIEEGDVESNTPDRYTLRATLRGWTNGVTSSGPTQIGTTRIPPR